MSMTDILHRIGEEARKLSRREDMPIDLRAYEEAGREPTEPVLNGSGDPAAQLCIFGRDPGRTEIELGEPFIGKGGQLVRAELHRALWGEGTPDLTQSIEAGRHVFWANTVPFKPLGNKAWSARVKRRFAPLIREVLVDVWQGDIAITLGNHAFFWFGMADSRNKTALDEYWTQQDRYEARIDVQLGHKRITLLPLPHPSPLNATWHARFPGMLKSRLADIGWSA